jgi:hypothetical protein
VKAIHTVHDAVLQLPVSVCRSGKLIYSFRLCAALVVVYSFYFHYKYTLHGPPLWSSGQSSWLQIQRPGFDSRQYQIFWKKKKENK